MVPMLPRTPRPGAHTDSPEPDVLGALLYRFFFYGWLFRDAYGGGAVERSIALEHNRIQAKWLPIYMWRWAGLGAGLAALEALSQPLIESPLLSAVLAVGMTFVVLFELVTTICWAFLRATRV